MGDKLACHSIALAKYYPISFGLRFISFFVDINEMACARNFRARKACRISNYIIGIYKLNKVYYNYIYFCYLCFVCSTYLFSQAIGRLPLHVPSSTEDVDDLSS